MMDGKKPNYELSHLHKLINLPHSPPGAGLKLIPDFSVIPNTIQFLNSANLLLMNIVSSYSPSTFALYD
jgi:hypothetical protein